VDLAVVGVALVVSAVDVVVLSPFVVLIVVVVALAVGDGNHSRIDLLIKEFYHRGSAELPMHGTHGVRCERANGSAACSCLANLAILGF
jgi:hypothetical protein